MWQPALTLHCSLERCPLSTGTVGAGSTVGREFCASFLGVVPELFRRFGKVCDKGSQSNSSPSLDSKRSLRSFGALALWQVAWMTLRKDLGFPLVEDGALRKNHRDTHGSGTHAYLAGGACEIDVGSAAQNRSDQMRPGFLRFSGQTGRKGFASTPLCWAGWKMVPTAARACSSNA